MCCEEAVCNSTPNQCNEEPGMIAVSCKAQYRTYGMLLYYFGCMAICNGMYNVPGILPAMNIT
jgi:hypothetical protein